LKQGRATITVPFDDLVDLVPSDVSEEHDEYLTYQTFLVVANVTERATGKILSGNSTVACHSVMYQLEFLDMTPNSYKPGLDFTGYVRLLCPVVSLFVFKKAKKYLIPAE